MTRSCNVDLVNIFVGNNGNVLYTSGKENIFRLTFVYF